ncbi:hypothetical protein ACFL4A_01605 [bacterium]
MKIFLKVNLSTILVLLSVQILSAKIDIGSDIDIHSMRQSNYSTFSNFDQYNHKFTIQRTKFYLNGELQKGVKAYFKMQSVGIWGLDNNPYEVSSSTRIIYGNYSYPNFSPWIENAYIEIENLSGQKEIFDLNFKVGKQPISYGDGLVIDDDGHGMFAFKLRLDLPYRLGVDYFSAKPYDSQNAQAGEEAPIYLSGYVLDWKYKNIRPSVYYMIEDDDSGKLITDGHSKKTFYGFRFDATTEQDLTVKFEYIKQGGKVTKNNPENNFSYDSAAYVLGTSVRTVSPRFGVVDIYIEYAYGQGDKNETVENQFKSKNGFSPFFGAKSRDNGKKYYGEIAGQLYPGLSNKAVTAFGLKVNPYKTFYLGFDYFRLKRLQPELVYGEEVDMKVGFKYSYSVSFDLIYAFFSPSENVKNNFANIATISETSLRIGYKF